MTEQWLLNVNNCEQWLLTTVVDRVQHNIVRQCAAQHCNKLLTTLHQVVHFSACSPRVLAGSAVRVNLTWLTLGITRHECTVFDLIANLGLGGKNGTLVSVTRMINRKPYCQWLELRMHIHSDNL